MRIRPFVQDDLARVTELTIETFGPFYEEHFRPLVGEAVFANQHGDWRGDWRGDYHRQLAGLHDPARHKHVAVAEPEPGSEPAPGSGIAGYVAWSVDPARRNGVISHLAVGSARRRHGLGTALCEHAFGALREHGAEVVEIGTGGDPFHAPARALYDRLGCVALPVVVYYRRL
ncbi:GNAT family N-acetyltransferase [Nonomuraea sp. NPDC050783]|uniref:GNAT family N-acetyltransferase n=1 Tax=Nonomuraea sp. NPDC050783 TaxID=3154634 RepID=UPI0034651623